MELPDHWPLQHAKTRFSELVRLAKSKGPQHVTVHGREEVVVISVDDYRRLTEGQTGQAVIDAFQACPYPDELKLEASLGPMPVRDVEL